MITGVNHITIAVSDLERSFAFYVDLLGCQPKARWNSGAYLVANTLWICLSVDPAVPADDYSHLAFSVKKVRFSESVNRLVAFGVKCWKTNISEGDSFYFLDPDGHKLELHCGDISSRMTAVDADPYPGWTRFANKEV